MRQSWYFGPLLMAFSVSAQTPNPQQLFAAHCGPCHGEDAKGSAQGPGLALNPRVAERSIDELSAYVRAGNTGAGMPSFASLPDNEMAVLAKYLKRINNDTILTPIVSGPHKTSWLPPQPGDWLTYNGNESGNRYSPLKQIDTSNVASLNLKWVFPISHFGLETTPLEAEGVLYVTGPNQVFALDAHTGNALWHYSRPPSAALVGDASLGTNRGVAILRDKVFFVTDNAHLLALDRGNGKLLWDKPMAPQMEPGAKYYYGGTMAPLIVHDNVIVGVAGADHGIRGFVAAFKAGDGALAWRQWTIPRKGDPGIETWQGPEPLTGGGSTWLTGSYDTASDTLFWPTGNPWPDSDDRNRPGDNLYTNCVLAMNPRTGEIKWHYQFTPHDVKDRDATEPDVLVDTTYKGKPSQLLLHADRNGFFYVFDRRDGKLLLAKTFLRRVDWASGIGEDGRPKVTDPRGCPSDATNWSSTAFSPDTHLYYFLALEECTGEPTRYPDHTGQHFLRAVDIETGAIAWEAPQPGPARAKTWSGVLATAGGLVFYGRPNGGFVAVDGKTGKMLWEMPTNVRMKASPITFSTGGKQYIAVAAGPNILCFGL
jgi:PQQ-dependent dehydrogenase (methanol/ethanol family)